MSSEPTDQSQETRTLFADFLERTPLGTAVHISDLLRWRDGHNRVVTQPEIQIYCDSDVCKGVRFFACADKERLFSGGGLTIFLTYICRNCSKTEKIYSLLLLEGEEGKLHGTAIKFGELPAFGPPIPPRVIKLIGLDREVFIRGRRSENQGLGIGAFAYYRRVVENQKGRLIREIGKVAERLGARAKELQEFERAAKETQFSKAIEQIKDAIPQVLLINGHNPLSLLHRALSEGLHAGTDEECLELATSIRVVLTELSERISHALKDEAELRLAISKLMQSKKVDPNGFA